MATQFNLKTATPDTSFPSGGFLFGADSQSASDPSIYSSDAYLNYLVTVASAWSAAQTFTSAAPQLTLGVNATTLGSIKLFGNTSGDATLRPTAAAGTATVCTLPATTTTLAGLAVVQTFSAANTFTSAAPQLTLGVNTTTLGSIKMFGNTSGDVTLQPSAVAGTATTLTLPATTSTLAGLAIGQTFTATQTITPAANTNALAVTGYSVTGSGTTALLDLAGTWNTSGVASGIDLNLTQTAAANGSTYFRARSGATVNVALGATSVGSTAYALWLGPTGGTTTASNYLIQRFSASTYFNTDSSSFYVFYENNSTGLFSAQTNRFNIKQDAWLGWATDHTSTTSGSPRLYRDGADNVLGQRVGTNAQFHNLYATYTSATDYHRVQIGTAKTTLASVSGATVTATSLIPDGAIVVGVTTKVTVSLGTGGGTTGYQVGDGSDADRWGQIAGTAAGTSTDNTNWTATTVQAFTSAQNVVITADGGNFNGTGSIEVAVQYLIGQCD